jgi:DnaJ like chaperone protein
MWATFGGAGVGLAIGGPLGALIGALAGHFLVDAEGALLRPASRDTVFMTGLIALSAKMAKADGVVTRDEVSAFRSLVIVPEEGMASVQALFDLAKDTTHGYEAYARQIADLYANEPMLREDVLDGLFHIAKADGAVHEAEYAYLEHVASIFGFDTLAFERIAARHVRLQNDPYLVLGANREMDDKTIKAHYRRLVADIHPDKEIARGLPPEAVSIATTRLAAVNAAWEQVKQERGLT